MVSIMDHFAVIQSIVRAGLSGDKQALVKQVERLRGRLEKDGSKKESETIARLIRAAEDVKQLVPSEVVVSRALVTGEKLTENVNPPIDKETGASLCFIEFPASLGAVSKPVYDKRSEEAVDGLVKEWGSATELAKLGVRPTHSLLIFGPPGSGKTMTAYHLCNSLGLPLVVARIDGLISSFLGTTARNISNLFEFANRYQCVLLLDEFDALAKLRDDPQEVGEIKRVVNSLLQNLDLRREFGITLAITNHDRLLDPAVWRRFETQLNLVEPTKSSRLQLVRRFLKPIDADDSLVSIYALCLKGISGSEIERFCDSIKRYLAVNNLKGSSEELFQALAHVYSHIPVRHTDEGLLNTNTIDDFIGHIANDSSLNITQSELARITGKNQSAISKLKKTAITTQAKEG